MTDCPSLAQIITIIILSINYINTIESMKTNDTKAYKIYKILLSIFIPIYTPFFITMNYLMVYKDWCDGYAKTFFSTAMVGQFLTFLSFAILVCILGSKLKNFYLESSKLYIFARLLFTRLSVALLNILSILNYMRMNGTLCIYVIMNITTFEILPTVLLIVLSSLQEKK